MDLGSKTGNLESVLYGFGTVYVKPLHYTYSWVCIYTVLIHVPIHILYYIRITILCYAIIVMTVAAAGTLPPYGLF